ncbi:MAG: prolyl oligopeptidase family serine peptidase [Chitinophagales bacterium]|nr:prolyl oligopeptidase family serine peptidase [Chitinophagales bacterium]
MKQLFNTLVCISLFLCAQAQNEFLVSYELVESYTIEDLKAKWKESKIKEFISPVKYEVAGYEIMYKTRWHDGSEILASGFVYVPQKVEEEIPTLIMNHGTTLKKEMNMKLGGLMAGCVAFATDGYLVLYPHYIGLGKGEKTHLYQIADSEAYSNIDMLRAVRELKKEISFETNEQLFITGYSQGGHAAMAAHKMIQEEYSNEFQVTASAPMSGAYDMTGIQSGVMFEKYKHQAYLPYLLLSLEERYQMWDGDIYDVFKEPYRSVIKEKLNHEHSLNEVSKLLPEVPSDMMRDDLIAEFKSNPDFIFTKVLSLNNNYDWKPESPMMLCYCNADEQVSYKNAFIARDKMKENGAERVFVRNGGKKYGHNKCALFSLMNTKFFFDSIKDGDEDGNKGKLMKRFLVSLAKLAVKP